MEILLFMAGALLGFIFGGIFGMCQMDNLHHRVRSSGGYQPIDTGKPLCNPPRSIRPTPPSKE